MRLTVARTVFMLPSLEISLKCSSRLRCAKQNCCVLFPVGWSADIKAVELRRPNRRAGPWRRGNFPNEIVMICVFLVVDVYKSRFEPSAPGGINTLVRSVIPKVVDSGDALKPRNLFTRLCVQDNQRGRVTNAVEKSMMILIERERDIRLNSCRPGFNLLALLEINHSKPGRSGKRNVNLRPRFFDPDTTGPSIGLNICDVFVGARIDDG